MSRGSPPTKSKFAGDGSFPAASAAQKPLPGRNILLGSMLEATLLLCGRH